MTPELEAMIQDYLDDRLDASERVAFEARLGKDPALSRRVEDHAGLRASLREVDQGEIEPSPGFYTRARARFEEAQRPRRRFALLSWEAAGLAATVAVIAVLFVPALMRRDPAVLAPPMESRSATTPELESQKEGSLGLSHEGAASSADLMKGDTTEESFAPAPAPTAAPVAAPVDDLGRMESKREVAPKSLPAPIVKSKKAVESRKDAAESVSPGKRSRRQAAAGARMAEAVGEEDTEVQEQVMQDAPAGPGRAPVEYEQDQRAAGDVKADADLSYLAVRATPLKSPAVPPGQVLVLSGATEIAELRRKEPELDRLMAAHPEMRVVLIGPRARPLSCDRLQWQVESADHLIEAGLPGPASELAPLGCAILLPRDGRAVKVTEGS